MKRKKSPYKRSQIPEINTYDTQSQNAKPKKTVQEEKSANLKKYDKDSIKYVYNNNHKV